MAQKKAEGSGCGVYNEELGIKISEPLGNYASITQAELHAIEMCARIIKNNNIQQRKVFIATDSQTSIKILTKNTFNSKSALVCLQELKIAAKNNDITLTWVPSHSGIEGNETADELARTGAETDFVGAEPCFGIPLNSFKQQNKEWVLEKSNLYWRNRDDAKEARNLIGNYSKKKTDKLLTYDKNTIRTLTHFLTGHGPFRKCIKKIKKTTDPTYDDFCRFCFEEVESAEHLLCRCNAIENLRYNIIRCAKPEPEDFRIINLNSLCKLVNKIKIKLEFINIS